MISFVFYLPANRSNVFQQQLRMLESREDLSECEAVVVWHGVPCDVDLSAFKYQTVTSLNLPKYNKSILVNRGVKLAKGEILAILDADRVLPPDYFKIVSQSLNYGTAAAPLHMIKILQQTDDKSIWERRFPYKRDDRTKTITPFRKHLFSGNTVLFKEDYLAAGGMNEDYWGYGFNDLDFGKIWLGGGFKVEWIMEAEEIHLHHPHPDQIDPTGFHAQNAANAFRFCQKWKLPLPELFQPELALRSIPML